MSSKFYLGQRLSYEGDLCTVRYIGNVAGIEGTWLGVEWDDVSRGKHAGEHNGINYFKCKQTGTPGSFIRPNRPHDQPRNFLQALKVKYASELEEVAHGVVEKAIRISGKEVEEVGFDKVRRQLADLHELRIVLLDEMRITAREQNDYASPKKDDEKGRSTLNEIRETCPNILELDISRNLFEKWGEVVSICEQLEHLGGLRVGENRFRDISLTDSDVAHCKHIFNKVKDLSLEVTLLDWNESVSLANLFPNITSLSLSGNQYTTLPLGYLSSPITVLTLQDNKFSTLTDLLPLTRLATLQRLILKQNKISDATKPEERDPTGSKNKLPIFPVSVTDVDLSHNAISTWCFIHALGEAFPGLTSLRVAHNPLYRDLRHPADDSRPLTADDGYMLTVARLPKLKSLNFSTITDKDRLNAESYYLSLIAAELSANPASSEPAILARHPRFAALCAEYGDPVVRREVGAFNPNSLAARLLRLRCRLGPSALAAKAAANVKGHNNGERFVVEVPRTFNVYGVLGLVGKRCGLPPMRLKLVWETGEWDYPVPAASSASAASEGSGGVAPAMLDWDSESEDGSIALVKVPREVHLVAGTRAVGTWVDGLEVNVRVEMLDRQLGNTG
ncbi:hypothetical protein BDY21DRAFT_314817 [Lineolata rhizophorae]|uniref:CAP-Gly domain-containing protein n=1 Tax=Lineolata rhizophorae TaxID=578093 RepID=A0A6A6PAH7_9PEZI|nr:hypothetical protein BDY21DRAFT_314817 [Lineolata rhizophorae]